MIKFPDSMSSMLVSLILLQISKIKIKKTATKNAAIIFWITFFSYFDMSYFYLKKIPL